MKWVYNYYLVFVKLFLLKICWFESLVIVFQHLFLDRHCAAREKDEILRQIIIKRYELVKT